VILTLTRTTGFGFLAVGCSSSRPAPQPWTSGSCSQVRIALHRPHVLFGNLLVDLPVTSSNPNPDPMEGSLATAALLLAAMAISSVLG